MAALKAAEGSKLAKAKAASIPDVEAKPGEPRRSQRLVERGKDQKTNRTEGS